MKKIFLAIFALTALSIGTLAYLRYSNTPELIIPYPYQVLMKSENQFNSQVAIVGDGLAKQLDRYQDRLKDELKAANLASLSVKNFGMPNEGLHRTLARLKNLKTWPKLIVFFGSGSEFYEKKFEITDYSKIISNFKKYEDENTSSLIMTFPILSHYLYQPVHFQSLTSLPKQAYELKETDSLKWLEMTFFIFQYEFSEFLELALKNHSKVIIITAPYKLDSLIKRSCAQSMTETMAQELSRIQTLQLEGNSKQALAELQPLIEHMPVNARAQYLLGEIYVGVGDFAGAKQAFYNAHLYDCQIWRAHPVFNSIMKKEAQKRSIQVIDFERNMINRFGEEGQFVDDRLPSDIYFHDLVKELALAMKQQLLF